METGDEKKYLEYYKIRNKVRALTRTLRKEFERNVANQTKKTPKAFWQYYKSKTTMKPGIGKLNIDPTNPKSNTTTDDGENILATYFVSVFTTEEPGEMPTIPRVETNTMMERVKLKAKYYLH